MRQGAIAAVIERSAKAGDGSHDALHEVLMLDLMGFCQSNSSDSIGERRWSSGDRSTGQTVRGVSGTICTLAYKLGLLSLSLS